MNSNVTRFLFCACALVLNQSSFAQGPKSVDDHKSVQSLAKAYYDTFGKATAAELTEFRRQSHDGLAIRAVWEEIRRTIPQGKPTTASFPIDSLKLSRFLRYVEGRLNVRIPDWWERRMQKARAHSIDPLYPALLKSMGPRVYLARPLEHDINPTRTTPKGFQTSRGVAVRESNTGTLTLEMKGKAIDLPKEVTVKKNAISAIRHANGIVVATYRRAGYECDVYRLKDNGEVMWKAKAWGEDTAGTGQTGMGYHHWVEFVVDKHENRLFVFGGLDNSMYLECFKLDDGDNVFRFCTEY